MKKLTLSLHIKLFQNKKFKQTIGETNDERTALPSSPLLPQRLPPPLQAGRALLRPPTAGPDPQACLQEPLKTQGVAPHCSSQGLSGGWDDPGLPSTCDCARMYDATLTWQPLVPAGRLGQGSNCPSAVAGGTPKVLLSYENSKAATPHRRWGHFTVVPAHRARRPVFGPSCWWSARHSPFLMPYFQAFQSPGSFFLKRNTHRKGQRIKEPFSAAAQNSA